MARYDVDSGFHPTELSEFIQDMNQLLRDIFGNDLDLRPETPQGQLAGTFAAAFTITDENIINVVAGQNLNQSKGKQLQDYGTLLDIRFRKATFSTVVATLTGTATTVIDEGSRIQDGDGNIFALDSDVTIPTGGSVDGNFTAVVAGALDIAADAVNQIVDSVTGWDSVTNAAAVVTGLNNESFSGYRARYRSILAKYSQNSNDSLRSRILNVDAVTNCEIFDNEEDSSVTLQGLTIAANSFMVIVEGGSDTDIGDEILRSKPLGIPTNGTTTHTSGGRTARFTRVDLLPVKVNVTIQLRSNFPGNGIQQIRQRVVDWVSGDWSSGVGDFDTTGLQIGEYLDINRLYSPINSVQGHIVTALEFTDSMDNAISSPITLNQRITLVFSDVNVTVT